MYDVLVNIVTESWLVLGQMSPYLLLGFLVAGVLSVCISPELVERHLGGRGLGPVLKASLFGVPLPLCSCGVIPVSASLRQHGASRAATTSFLLSTPQTGVDSIAVTYALLGPVFAVFRPIVALLTGFVGGGLVQLFGDPNGAGRAGWAPPTSRLEDGGQCPPYACADACCTGKHEKNAFVRVLRYGFVTLPRDIGLALLVGVLIAGALSALVPQDRLSAYIGGGVLSILILMAAGVPIYVCATASVPIAAGFMHLGASPGAALAFLIAGPATNAATITTIWKVLGRRTAGLYLVSVAASAVASGLLLNLLVPAAEAVSPQLGSHAHSVAEGGWFYHVAAIVLLAVLGLSYWPVGPVSDRSSRDSGTGGTKEDRGADGASAQQSRLEFLVKGMTCSHCAESVRRALAEVGGVRSAEVNLASGQVIVRGDHLNREQLAATVTGLGYAAKVLDDAEARPHDSCEK